MLYTLYHLTTKAPKAIVQKKIPNASAYLAACIITLLLGYCSSYGSYKDQFKGKSDFEAFVKSELDATNVRASAAAALLKGVHTVVEFETTDGDLKKSYECVLTQSQKYYDKHSSVFQKTIDQQNAEKDQPALNYSVEKYYNAICSVRSYDPAKFVKKSKSKSPAKPIWVTKKGFSFNKKMPPAATLRLGDTFTITKAKLEQMGLGSFKVNFGRIFVETTKNKTDYQLVIETKPTSGTIQRISCQKGCSLKNKVYTGIYKVEVQKSKKKNVLKKGKATKKGAMIYRTKGLELRFTADTDTSNSFLESIAIGKKVQL